MTSTERREKTMRYAIIISSIVTLGLLTLGLAGCRQGNDADLETPEYAKSQISLDGPATARITSGNKIEVEGPATNNDKFQHDVYFKAILTDAEGKTVGTATGRLEDWPAGHHGIYKLVGTASATIWAKVTVVVSDVTEHVRGRREY
jgi:hypothetical protein